MSTEKRNASESFLAFPEESNPTEVYPPKI
jgi:hypothetical protein